MSIPDLQVPLKVKNIATNCATPCRSPNARTLPSGPSLTTCSEPKNDADSQNAFRVIPFTMTPVYNTLTPCPCPCQCPCQCQWRSSHSMLMRMSPSLVSTMPWNPTRTLAPLIGLGPLVAPPAELPLSLGVPDALSPP